MPETIIWSQPITFTETAKGAPGPAGPAGPQYGLRCDTSSIVRELVSNNAGVIGVSPQNINFTALKNNGDTDNPSQEIITCGEDYLIKLYQIPIASIGYSSLIENGETLKPISYFKTDDQGNESQSTVADYDKIRLNTSSYAFNGDENNKNASAIKAQLSYKGTVLVELSIPFVLSNSLLEIAQIDGDTVKIAGGKVYADAIVSEAVTAVAIKAGSIETSHFAGQVIDSATKVTFPLKEGSITEFDERHYTETGSRINLGPDPETNGGGGSIHFRNFYVDPQGNAGLRGRIEAQEGAITGLLGIGAGDGKGNYPIYIDGSNNENLDALNINGYFRVSKDGTTSITKGSIAGWTITQDQLSADNESVGMYSGGALKWKDNAIRFFAGIGKNEEGKIIDYKFIVDNDGNLYAQQANLTSGNIYGNFYVGQNGQTHGITIDGVNGDISTSQFASGAYGWKIDQNGNAEFNNATIRGKLTSVIFEKQTVSAINGDLYIAPSYVLKKELQTGISVEDNTVIFSFSKPDDFPSDWKSGTQVLLGFSRGDNIYSNVSGRLDKITEDGVTEITLTFPQLSGSLSIEGQDFVSSDIQIITIGTVDTTNTINYKYIYLTANNDKSPFIDVQDYKSGDMNPLPKVRMGRLDGITDTMNGFGQLSGYGFYCSNAYLTGELNLPQAGITNQNTVGFDGTSYINNPTEGQTIRFWAGGNAKPHKPAEDENVKIASFIVTQDGSLYASQGVFKGQIIATNSTFSGTISAAGIVVEKGGDGYNPDINKNHFFVGYKEEPTSFDDYVLDMSSAGLSIWEGGFRAYSDVLSGWEADGTKDETKAKFPYGYTSDNSQPFPYIAAIDEGRFSTREWHNIGISVDGNNYKTTSILARDGKLFFGSNSINKDKNPDYISVEKNAYGMTKNVYLGLQDNKLQIYSDTGTTIEGGRVQVETELYIKEIANIGGVSIRKATKEESADTIGLNFIFE